VLAAVLMIAGATFIRGRLDANDVAREAEAGRVTGALVCAAELRDVCDALRAANPGLEIRIEEAAATEATLASTSFNPGTAKIDAWLVPQPYPAMVDETRRAASGEPVLGEASAVLARSPLVLAVWNDRLGALAAACGGTPATVTWACIGTNAGKAWSELGGQETWGTLKPGVPDPDRGATGLAVVAQATTQFLARPDFARNDLEAADYQAWLGQLKRSMPASGTAAGPLEQMLSLGKSTFDLAGSVEAIAGPAVTTGREKDRVTILYPSPMSTLDIVLVPVKGSQPGERVKNLLQTTPAREALAQHGWRVPGLAAVAGIRDDQQLPAASGLPRAGVMLALRTTFDGVAR